MPAYISEDTKKVTTRKFQEMKQKGEKISMLTAYDYTMAKIIDAAGVDSILIGDSASNVMAGNTFTLPITLDQMIYHASCVVRAVKHALVVCDMPFGTYQGNPYDAFDNAVRVVKESGADALKLEGGERILPALKLIIDAGMPVCGHLGLTPQSVNQIGYGLRAKEEAEAAKLIKEAHQLEEVGCFALVLEKVPAQLAARVSKELTIPVIGIGAGSGTDGQVLVGQDMLGMTVGFKPKFLRVYADCNTVITDAVGQYVRDVKDGTFPSESEQY